MRVIKLGDEFPTREDALRFFRTELWERTPPGKFRVTAGRIAAGALEPREPLLFTHCGRVLFTARAGSGLVDNDDGERDRYPSYFVVDRESLREVDEPVVVIEEQYNAAAGTAVNISRSQGWNRLEDSAHTELVWSRLRGV